MEALVPKKKSDKPHPVPSAFGVRLKELREARAWSQYELAVAAGVFPQVISSIERGVSDPSWPTAVAIADALGVSLDVFKGSK